MNKATYRVRNQHSDSPHPDLDAWSIHYTFPSPSSSAFLLKKLFVSIRKSLARSASSTTLREGHSPYSTTRWTRHAGCVVSHNGHCHKRFVVYKALLQRIGVKIGTLRRSFGWWQSYKWNQLLLRNRCCSGSAMFYWASLPQATTTRWSTQVELC